MRKNSIIGLVSATVLLAAGCQKINDLEGRVDALEDKTAKIEKTISELQAAVDGKYAVDKVEDIDGGYRIVFTNGKHIDLLNGKDGAPGKDGADGAPGKDGADGAPGKDGADGAPGKDGADGAPGKDGDSFFKSVTVTAEYVTVVLNDEAQTTFVLPVAVKILIGSDEKFIEVKGAKTTVAVTIPALENIASATATVVEGSVVTKAASAKWEAVLASDCKSVVIKAADAVTNDAALLQIIVAKADGTTYTASKAVKCTESHVTLGGYDYKTVRMKDGRVWTAENLHYVPEGLTVSPAAASYDSDGSAGVWYPADFSISEDGKGVATPTDSEEAVKQMGLLYNIAAVFGTALPTTDFEDIADPRGICPEGWHVPTAEEWISLVGACSNSARTDVEAPYYVNGLKGASLEALNADGFNFLPYPYCNHNKNNSQLSYLGYYLQKDSEKPFYGFCSIGYFHSSTGRSADMSYAAMITNNATKSSVNCAYNNFKNAIAVRCIRDAR